MENRVGVVVSEYFIDRGMLRKKVLVCAGGRINDKIEPVARL